MNWDWRSSGPVAELASLERWTWTQVGSDGRKKPMDARAYASSGGRLCMGARHHDGRCLMTLAEVDSMAAKLGGVPHNRALWLGSDEQPYVVLDIEPECPEGLKEELLGSAYLYGERSLSGRGVHLLLPRPEAAGSHEAAAARPALKDRGCRYEVLQNHFCTFTGDAIDPVENPKGAYDFEALWTRLAEEAPGAPAPAHELEVPESLAHLDGAAALVQRYVDECSPGRPRAYRKAPGDFLHEEGEGAGRPDMNRWEWGFIGHAWDWLQREAAPALGRMPTPGEAALLLYAMVGTAIPHRKKHEGSRSGMPYLRWRCESYAARHGLSDLSEPALPDRDDIRAMLGQFSLDCATGAVAWDKRPSDFGGDRGRLLWSALGASWRWLERNYDRWAERAALGDDHESALCAVLAAQARELLSERGLKEPPRLAAEARRFCRARIEERGR